MMKRLTISLLLISALATKAWPVTNTSVPLVSYPAYTNMLVPATFNNTQFNTAVFPVLLTNITGATGAGGGGGSGGASVAGTNIVVTTNGGGTSYTISQAVTNTMAAYVIPNTLIVSNVIVTAQILGPSFTMQGTTNTEIGNNGNTGEAKFKRLRIQGANDQTGPGILMSGGGDGLWSDQSVAMGLARNGANILTYSNLLAAGVMNSYGVSLTNNFTTTVASNNFVARGTNNNMPNQTVVDNGSVVNVGIGDGRYLVLTDTNLVLGKYTLKANNGSDFSNIRNTASNIAFVEMSPAAGNNAYADMQAASGRFVGQLGASFFGNTNIFLWPYGGAGAGDWQHPVTFAAGMSSIGDHTTANVMAKGLNNLDVTVGWHAADYDYTNRAADSGIRMTTGETYGSGLSLLFNATITNGLGVPIQVGNGNDAALTFNYTNSLVANGEGLIPGWFYRVINYKPYMLGIGDAVANPSQMSTGGNYSSTMFDAGNAITYIPVWQNGIFRPSNAGFKGHSFNHVSGAISLLGVTTLSNLVVTGPSSQAAVIVSSLTNSGLTASSPVFTDANKALTSTGTIPDANLSGNVALLTDFNQNQFDTNSGLVLIRSSSMITNINAHGVFTVTNAAAGNHVDITQGGIVLSNAQTGAFATISNGWASVQGLTNSGNIKYSQNPISGGVLSSDASGNATWSLNGGSLTNYTPTIQSPKTRRTLFVKQSIVSSVGSTETAYSSNNIVANTLGSDGTRILYNVYGTNAVDATKIYTYKLYYGTNNVVFNKTMTSLALVSQFNINIEVRRVSSSLVAIFGTVITSSMGSSASPLVGNILLTSAVDCTLDQPLSFTVTANAGSANGDINPWMESGDYVPSP